MALPSEKCNWKNEGKANVYGGVFWPAHTSTSATTLLKGVGHEMAYTVTVRPVSVVCLSGSCCALARGAESSSAAASMRAVVRMEPARLEWIVIVTRGRCHAG